MNCVCERRKGGSTALGICSECRTADCWLLSAVCCLLSTVLLSYPEKYNHQSASISINHRVRGIRRYQYDNNIPVIYPIWYQYPYPYPPSSDISSSNSNSNSNSPVNKSWHNQMADAVSATAYPHPRHHDSVVVVIHYCAWHRAWWFIASEAICSVRNHLSLFHTPPTIEHRIHRVRCLPSDVDVLIVSCYQRIIGHDICF